jgi:hypothetical protein
MRHLPKFFLFVDVGFMVYWFITLMHLIPAPYLYNDYTNPLMVAWNWSFFPIDMLISFTGLGSLRMRGKRDVRWTSLALVSLVLTMASGLMAISFWTLTRDFSLQWWLPNLFLLLYPPFFILKLIRNPGS